MASVKPGNGHLTDKMLIHLSENLSCQSLRRLAITHLDLSMEFVDNTDAACRTDKVEFNRLILREWRNRNSASGVNQIEKLRHLLADAARSTGAVDMAKINTILVEEDTDADSEENVEESGQQLTDSHLSLLSQWITDESMLRSLCVTGLGLTGAEVSRELTNHPRDIAGASYRLLENWRGGQPSKSDAYQTMLEALQTAGLPLLIHEVLKPETSR